MHRCKATGSNPNAELAPMRALYVKSTTTALPAVPKKETLKLFGAASVSYPGFSSRPCRDQKLTPCLQVALERRLSVDMSGNGDCLFADAGLTHSGHTPGAHSVSEIDNMQIHQLPSPSERRPSWEGEIHVQSLPLTPTQLPLPDALPHFKFPPSPPSPPKRALIHDMMRADL